MTALTDHQRIVIAAREERAATAAAYGITLQEETPMLRAIINTPSGYYQGESATEEVPARATDNALRSGFHNHNHTGDMMDALVFSDEPKEHFGERAIMGAMERIMRYVRYGHMTTGEIVVDVCHTDVQS